MGAGCPVVVSDQAALAKPIKGAGAGVAVQLEPHAIAAALTTLLDDGQLRSSLASAGIDLIRTHFNWTRVGNELESLYGVIQQTKLSASKYETARSVS
jgi:colanic acid biosynthesis glycosyl transferase WcaI